MDVHPIEYLRHLARSGDSDPEWLVPEAAAALRALTGDRHGLVMGCRKLLEHHPRCGPLWWLCGHLLMARSPRTALDELTGTFAQDPTRLHLSLALADVAEAETSPRIVDTMLLAPGGVLVDAEVSTGTDPVWVIAGVGTVVPDEILTAARRAEKSDSGRRRRGRAVVTVDLEQVDRVVRPTGVLAPGEAAAHPDVPVVPELFSRG